MPPLIPITIHPNYQRLLVEANMGLCFRMANDFIRKQPSDTLRMMGGAEEIQSIALAYFWQYAASYQPGYVVNGRYVRFSTYICGNLKLRLLDYYNQCCQRYTRERREQGYDLALIAAPTPETSDLTDLVRQGLRRLTPLQRQLAQRYYLDRQPIPVILRELGLSRSKFKLLRETLAHTLGRFLGRVPKKSICRANKRACAIAS